MIYWKILRRRLICLASLKMIHTFYIFHVCFYAIISSVILCRVIKSQLILLKATLWSYQLLQKGRRFSAAKLHYIDFNGPLMPLSCIDIRYWVSYNPEICRKSWKMTSRKKIRFLGLAQIVPLFNGLIFKKSLFGTKRF